MTALDDIEAATAALNNLTAQEVAEKARIDAAVAAALKATVARERVVYLDAVAGLDANDGSAPANAVATMAAALALIGAGQLGTIELLSDVVIPSQLVVDCQVNVTSYGVAVDGTGAAIRTVTIAPPSIANAYPGACGIAMLAHAWLEFYHVTLQIGALQPMAGQTTAVFIASGTVVLTNVALSLDPGLAVPVFSSAAFLSVLFNSVSLPAGYAGKLFLGAAAGTNPNSPTVRTNLLAA